MERSREFGESYLALSLWHRFGLDKLLTELLPEGRESVWLPLVAALVAGAVGYVVGRTDDRVQRLVVGMGGLGALGVFAAAMTREQYYPDFEIVPIVAWPLIVGAIGFGLNRLRGRPPVLGAVTGAAIGWLIGAWGMPDIGNDGTQAWTFGAMAVPPLLIGPRIGLGRIPDSTARSQLDQRAR